MIITLISYLFLFLTFYNSYKLIQKDPTLFKRVYFTKLKDYFLSSLMMISVLFTVIGILSIGIPDFLKFSWLNLLGGKGTNLIISPVSSAGSGHPGIITILASFIFYVALCICLPYLAKAEEEMFREGKISTSQRIKSSIVFGFIHMIVGVPLFVAIILCVLGWIFSERYINSFMKNLNTHSEKTANEVAIFDATSLHAKYNFLVLTIVYVFTVIIYFFG